MNAITARSRSTVTAFAIALALIATVGGPASARQDAGDPPTDVYAHLTPGQYPLERIGRQLVRGDNLTGAGVAAPLTVPEQR
jgi:hypothetical protein